MLKKMVAILLSITVMLTLCPVMGVFAALPTTSQTGYLTDNFDDKALSDYFANYSSSVFKNNSDGQQAYSIVPKDGSTTDKVLRFSSQKSDGSSTVSANTGLYIIDQNPGSDTMTIFSYDIRFKSFATGNKYMYLVRGGGFAGLKMNGDKINDPGGNISAKSLSADKWYKIVFMLGGNTNQNASVYVTDASTGEIVQNGYTGGTYSIDSLRAFSVPAATTGKLEFEIDNVELLSFDATAYAPGVKSSSIANGAEITDSITTLEVEFDQPLKSTGATINGETATMKAVNNKVNTYTVALPTLEIGTTYTVAFSDCKNFKDTASTDTITFTTKDEIVTISDDFNLREIGTVQGNYGSNITGILTASVGSNFAGTYNIVQGYEGAGLKVSMKDRKRIDASEALRSNNTVTAAEAYMAEGVTQYENLVATYRFNIGQMPSFNYPDKTSVTIDKEYNDVIFRGVDMRIGVAKQDENKFGVGKNTCAKIYTAFNGITYVHYGDDTNQENGYGVINENMWYDVIVGVNGTLVSISIKETVTGKKVWSHTFNPGTFEAGDKLTFILGGQSLNFSDSAQTQLWNHNMEVTFDDFTLYRIKPWVNSHKLTADYDAATKTISFNQPVASSDGIQLYKNINGENVTDSFGIGTFTSSDFCEMKVEYNENVFPGINYVCDYSKVKGITGIGFAENNSATKLFNFTVDSAPVSFASAAEYALTGGNMTFDFYSDVAQDAKFIAAFYNGDVLVKPVLIDKALTAGITSDISIPLGNDAITANRLRIFALDGAGKLIPLANSYDEDITK